jgi:hypothetical protein
LDRTVHVANAGIYEVRGVGVKLSEVKTRGEIVELCSVVITRESG